ncbi:unnamed protein product [Tetraodon nigroviridis]|uniref:Zinc finger protein 653 n=1 Tax=Tetraodon nigroviridis TaxID=99883 RepID=Q4T072_TETNG|nr:unnamed protein product [Tetraodon nigroviridis]
MAELAVTPDDHRAREQEKGVLRRCRGRPRLPDCDRAQRRLESRKKYDVRRVYLGESHKLWSELRRRTSLSDAGLAAYLILVNSAYGEKYQQKYYGKKIVPEFIEKHSIDRKTHVSSLQSLVCWYQEHCGSCPHEPFLRALEPQPNFSTAAIWQCDSNHSFVQHLFSPISESSDSEPEAEVNKDDGEIVAKIPQPMVKESRDEGEEEEEFEAGAATAPITHKGDKNDDDLVMSQSLSSSQTTIPEQSELFDPQSLHVPEQQNAVEGSQVGGAISPVTALFRTLNLPCSVFFHQLIIITGASYEALASEGIHLNMGGANMEEVTCTVIGGVTSSQICMSDPKRPAEDEDCITSLSDKQLLQPSAHALELQSKRELHRSLSSVQSKRNRRGPIIEADGMLKMFHCPYEGCSQVYVAISSFQNHINLVHRKGRTKVCPHPGCGKKFYLSNHLHRHMIIHSGVRDFICETCGKSFKRKNHLEVHRRTHTGETPLQCEICGYQCRQRASLNWHMKKHTPEAHYNYTCEFCHKRFEKLDSVKFHKVKSHPDKQTT